MLPNEEEQSEELRRLLQQSYSTPAPSDQFVKRLEERLLAILPATSRPLEPARSRNRITHWIGGFTVRQRIALGSMAITALLGLFLVWQGWETRPLSAMEKMAENIRKAKSFRATATGKRSFVFKSGDSRKTVESTTESKMTSYWLAPDSVRLEITNTNTWHGSGPEQVNVVPGANKPWISINNRTKTFRLHQSKANDVQESFFPDKLASFYGKADRELGTKEINGHKAQGFVIGSQKVNSGLQTPQQLEIWLDSETNLPVLINSEAKTKNMSATTETSNIQWNIDLDPKLFDASPPAGYRDTTPKAPISGDPVGHITEALKAYSRTPDGRYPPMKQLGVKDVEMLLESLDGIQSMLERGEFPFKIDSEQQKIRAAKFAKEGLQRIAKEREGFLHLWAIVDADRDVAYYGTAVTPKDKDKVLLRWKLDDGKYEVIFGDLRPETITAEKLKELERKSK